LIAVDTSSFRRYLEGVRDRDTQLVANALADGSAIVAGVVVTELLSKPELSGGSRSIVRSVRVLKLKEGFWERAAILRRNEFIDGRSGAIADVLIAQTCIDHRIPLITYDPDFRRFVPAGLQMA
jgi:predicted nucleic acid-binding protein